MSMTATHDAARPEAGVLQDITVVSIALNLPGPVAAARLQEMGARVITVLPPAGDPTGELVPALFEDLHQGQEIRTVDMRSASGPAEMADILRNADVFLTSHRSGTLRKLGLDFASVHELYPQVIQVDIVGFAGARSDVPGHDLNYQAEAGLLIDTELPNCLLADMHGAEQAVSGTLAALYARVRDGGAGRHVVVSLSGAAEAIALPLRYGMTHRSSPLGGASPFYAVYRAATGRVAVGALEPHFARALTETLGIHDDHDVAAQLSAAFAGQTAEYWQSWGEERAIPITAVKAL